MTAIISTITIALIIFSGAFSLTIAGLIMADLYEAVRNKKGK
jgi:hypothetical protein